MNKPKIPAPLKFIAAVFAAYVFFTIPAFFGAPIPVSIKLLYMLFACVMILLVMTVSDDGAKELFQPFDALFTHPSKKAHRVIFFIALPLAAAVFTYFIARPSNAPPAEARAIHPAPPSSFIAYGEAFNIATLENPFRELEAKDPLRFKELVKEGGAIYFKNCFFCHGAKLDGRGHYAEALNPRPLPFSGSDTISQLQESYLFWRIVKGGQGLPAEAAPWASSMPAWEKLLTEEEIWKTILFLYDYTGNSPRSWKRAGLKPVAVKPETYKGEDLKGKKIYEGKCVWCHGADGAGGGPSSAFLTPAPRDFTFGFFKWKTTPFDDYSPSASDLYRMISQGVNGTSMPGWADVLSKTEVKDVADYVKALGRFEYSQNAGAAPIKINASTDALIRGKRLFLDRCSECHGELGRGDALKRLKDDWGGRSWPRDLTKGRTFRFGSSASEIYARITNGISGTQMPSFADPKSRKMLTEDERKDVAVFVASLQEHGRAIETDGVIRARRVDGALPIDPDANEWQAARWTAFRLAPQIVADERLFNPTIDSISVKALYKENDVAFLIEWDDPTLSLPGDLKSAELAEGTLYQDGVAVQMPAGSVKKPYFGMGNASAAVNILLWLSPASPGKSASVKLMRAKGYDKIEKAELAKAGGIFAEGVYNKGRWQVAVKMPLNTERLEDGASAGVLAGKRFMPVAFAVWDGSNGENGARHTMTPWQWLSLEPEKSYGEYLWPLAMAIIVFAGEMFIYRTTRKSE